MSRMSRVAKAALAVAGVACFATSIAEASNMGFKLERSFNLERRANGSPLPNIFWVSQPLFNGLGDVSHFTPPSTTCCVGDAGCPVGDGAITAGDFVCDAWTARRNAGQEGAFQINWMNRATCNLVSFTGATLGARVVFTGTNFPLDREVGYQVNIGSNGPTITPQNPAVIVGSHDPGFTGRVIAPSLTCGVTAVQAEFLNLPYHTMFREADEILCGLKGTDWNPVGGNPDRCFEAGVGPTGLFDGTNPLQVQFFDNAAGNARFRTVALLGTRLTFSGVNFDLVPGESYKMIMTRSYLGGTWISAHY